MPADRGPAAAVRLPPRKRPPRPRPLPRPRPRLAGVANRASSALRWACRASCSLAMRSLSSWVRRMTLGLNLSPVLPEAEAVEAVVVARVDGARTTVGAAGVTELGPGSVIGASAAGGGSGLEAGGSVSEGCSASAAAAVAERVVPPRPRAPRAPRGRPLLPLGGFIGLWSFWGGILDAESLGVGGAEIWIGGISGSGFGVAR